MTFNENAERWHAMDRRGKALEERGQQKLTNRERALLWIHQWTRAEIGRGELAGNPELTLESLVRMIEDQSGPGEPTGEEGK